MCTEEKRYETIDRQVDKIARKFTGSRSRKKKRDTEGCRFSEKKVLPTSELPKTQAIRQSLPTTPLLYEAPEISLKASPTPIDVKHETTTPPGTDKRVDGEVLEFEELASPYV
jgi:hypothetical protein